MAKVAGKGCGRRLRAKVAGKGGPKMREGYFEPKYGVQAKQMRE